MLALEPRFLFDGAAAATVDQQEPAPAPEFQEAQEAQAESVAAEQLVQPGVSEASESSLMDSLALAPNSSVREVVFVDTAVQNYAQLLTGISPFAEVIILDSGRDGIQQISAALAGRENLQAVHILSHGADGAMNLGGVWLRSSNLDHYATAIAEWGTALSSDADVLLYGCDVAATESGRSLIEALSYLTGADVAASVDKTGHADLGGNWSLEYVIGAIEASIIVSETAQLDWFGLLTTATDDAGATTEDSPLVQGAPGVLANDSIPSSTVTGGAILNYDVTQDVTANDLWEDTATAVAPNLDWDFGTGTLNKNLSPVTNFPGITQVYDFPSNLGAGATALSFTNDAQTETSATFEFWLKVDASATSGSFRIYEAGGSGAGFSVIYDATNNEIELHYDDQDNAQTTTVVAALGSIDPHTEFIQVVAIFDDVAANPQNLQLHVNGGSGNGVGVTVTADLALEMDWANQPLATISSGLGVVAGTQEVTSGPAPVNFLGQMAYMRMYNSVLTAAQVEANFSAIANHMYVSGAQGNAALIPMSEPAPGAGPNSVLITTTKGALVTVFSNGSYTYDPNGQFESLAAGATDTDTFDYRASDIFGNTDIGTVTITINGVNDAPVIGNLNTDALAYSEGAGAVVIDQGAGATVTDVDSANFDTGTLTVSFTAGSDAAEDVLAIRNQGVAPGQIGVSGANVTYGGVTIGTFAGGSGGANLVITFNANASVAAVQALVQNITFQDTDTDNPTTGARTVQFVVTDGDGGTSAAVNATVTVSGVNDAPVVAGAGGTLAYSEGDGAQVIDNTLTITDVDNTNIVSATITISGGYVSGEDVLAFTNTVNITGVWNPGTGTLTLTGTDTLANYEAALESVTYENTNTDNPNTANRTITWVVNDGSLNSAGVTSTITVAGVNDAPAVAGAAGTLAYTEGDGAQVIDATLTITDVDNTNIVSATITISGGYVSGEDVLAFTNTASITGVWNPVTGTLTLTGSDTLANYELALESVTYENTNNADPNTGNRTITWVVNDGSLNSAGVTSTITVAAVNDAPVINDAVVALDENSANGTNVFNVNEFFTGNDTDVDGQALSYTITAGNGLGGFAINAATGQITVANSAALDFETTPVFNLTVEASDGSLTDTAVITVNLTDLDEVAPVVNDQSFNYAENQGAGATVATVVFSDNVGVTGFTFTATGTNTSSDGYYQISNTGVITLTAAGAAGEADDFETGANSFVHSVRAVDAAGNFDTANITLNLNNLNDNAPRIDDTSVALNENSANGTAVYDVNDFFTGNDTDLDGTALTYSITAGNALGGFAINAATGQVTVANSAMLDFETTPVFSLTIEASDGTLTDTAVMTINLNDLNEAPVVNATVGLNTPDLGEPSGVLPPVTLNPGAESGQSIGGPELFHRDFVLQGINESLRLRTEQAAQIAGLLTAANAGEIEAVSLEDSLRMEAAAFVLPTVEQIRSEFIAAGERALEFAVTPAPGTAPLLKDFDAFSRFVPLDQPKDEPAPAVEPVPDAPAGAQDSAPAEAAPDAPAAPNAERGAARDPQTAGAPAFSAQLRTAAALRKQLDTRLAESLRPPRKG